MARSALGIRFALGALLAFGSATSARATGLLAPSDRSVKPLGIVYQRVNVTIRDQAAVTRVEQQFRNHTSRQLEAYYLFPLPEGAGVRDFVMWVDGKRTTGELVEADKARRIYEDIVRRTKDPGLLEHMGKNLFRVRVFPIPPQGLQKIEISYSQVVGRDAGIAEYVYPLKTTGKSVQTERDFTLRVELHSSADLKSVYSPSHAIDVDRKGDHKAIVGFEQKHYPLDRDFRLFWTVGSEDVGLSLLTYRESPGEPGYFMALLSPKIDLPKTERVPRDVLFLVDTSGSMKGAKIEQARAGVEFCLKSLDPSDRFGVIGFATTVTEFEDDLVEASEKKVAKAVRWVKKLEASGGTAIDDALTATLAMRPDSERNFTVVFLTDGEPTIGETDPKAILANVVKRNDARTRIFVFGVGNDVNTHLLDQLAGKTRATSVYVRPKEDLEAKISSFYAKISHPVLASPKLKLRDSEIRLTDIYPPRLPDLFHGGQLLLLGRYEGDGAAVLRLRGKFGAKKKRFDYEVKFPEERHEGDFLPGIWARRKVGYLLDQIRLSGDNKELRDEVTRLAKKYGIVTPYTSYLVVPDGRVPLTAGRPGATSNRGLERLSRFGRRDSLEALPAPAADASRRLRERTLGGSESLGLSTGKQAVDVATTLGQMKGATESGAAAVKKIGASVFVDYGGVWVDRAHKPESKVVTIEYLSDAYFRILKLVPQAKSVFALGDRVAWVTPSGKTLVIDAKGESSLSDETIRALFAK